LLINNNTSRTNGMAYPCPFVGKNFTIR